MAVSDKLGDEDFVILDVSKPFMLPASFDGLQRNLGRAEPTRTRSHERALTISVSSLGDKCCRQVVGYNLGEGNNSENAGSNEGFMPQNRRVEIPDRQILPGGEYRGRSRTGTNFGSFAAETMQASSSSL